MVAAQQHAASGNYLFFEVGDSRFCAPVNDVEAIVELTAIHRLPFAPKGIAGTFMFRDRLAVVCDLGALLNVEANAARKDLSVVVRLPIGLIAFRVDHVSDIVAASEIRPQVADERAMKEWMDGYVMQGPHIAFLTSFDKLLGLFGVSSLAALASAAPAPLDDARDSPVVNAETTPGIVSFEPGPVVPPDAAVADDAERAGTQSLEFLPEARSAEEVPPAPAEPVPAAAATDEQAAIEPESRAAYAAEAVPSEPEPVAPLEAADSDEVGLDWAEARESLPEVQSGEQAPPAPIEPALEAAATDEQTAIEPESRVVQSVVAEPVPVSPSEAASAAQAVTESDESVERPPGELGEESPAAPIEPAPELDAIVEQADVESMPGAARAPGIDAVEPGVGEHDEAEAVDELVPAIAAVPEDLSERERRVPLADVQSDEAHEAKSWRGRVVEQSRLEFEEAAATQSPIAAWQRADAFDFDRRESQPKSPMSAGKRSYVAIAIAAAALPVAIAIGWWFLHGPAVERPDAAQQPAKSAASQQSETRPIEQAPARLEIVGEEFEMRVESAASARGKAPQPAPAAASRNEIVHVVAQGDTLWDIAAKHLGNPYRYPELARTSEIRNPNLIHPGDVVRIRKRR